MLSFFKKVYQLKTNVHFWGILYFLGSIFLFNTEIVKLVFNDLYTPPKIFETRLYLLCVFVYIFLVYFLIIRNINSIKNAKYLFFWGFVSMIILIISYPLGSLDIFNYFFTSRIFNVYNQNPYLMSFVNFYQDSFYYLTIEPWRENVSPYGPIFTIITIIINFLIQDKLFLNLLLIKIINLLFFLAAFYFFCKILIEVKKQDILKLSMIFFLNPLLLFEVMNNGHNDIMILFCIILSTYLIIRQRYQFSLTILFVSIFLKYSTLLLVPLFVLFIYKKEKRANFWICSMINFFIIALIAYAPFLGGGMEVFKGLKSQVSRADMFFYFGLFPFIFSLLPISLVWIKKILFFIFCIFYFRVLYNFSDTINDLLKRAFLIFLGYFIILAFWLQPWYFIWILPLPLIFLRKGGGIIVFWLTILGLLSYFIPISILFFFSAILFYILYKGNHLKTMNQ